jgi:radical SAM-linked protein
MLYFRRVLRVMTNQQRLRITFGKGESVKYISHLDLCQAWERALRRAGAPLAYSLGFHPQAKLQLAAALPVGYTSTAEVLDVILDRVVSFQEFRQQLPAVLPTGLLLVGVEDIDLRFPSLQSRLRQAEYRVTVQTATSDSEVARRIGRFLAADQIEQQRVRKQRTETVDLRPLVHDIQMETANRDGLTLRMRVSTGQHGNVRPVTVLAALGLGAARTQTERTNLLFRFDTRWASGYNHCL